MLSKERIILMSQATSLQLNNPKEMETIRYYRKEYIVAHFLLIWLYVSITYVIIAGLIAAVFIEEFPKEAQNADWLYVVATAGMIYFFIMCFYALITLVVYSLRYGRSQKVIKKYNNIIKQIGALYEEEIENVPVLKKEPAVEPPKKVVKKKTKKGGKK